MESADVGPDVSTEDSKKVVNKNRDWHKRLRLRKAAVQPQTMQSQDKCRPKKITEEWEQNTKQPFLMKPPQKAQQCQHRTSDIGHILRFRCAQCKVSSEFGPDDLVKHVQESHRGSSPVFPCHMCTFSTHEFSSLQVHLISHMDAFSSCNICNDNVQRTISEFTTHLTMHHNQNGKYLCKMCDEFSTRDVRVFLEHIHLHNIPLEKGSKFDHSNHARKDFQRQLRSKTITLSFHCHLCSYEAPNKRLITKHMNTVHAGQNVNQGMKEFHPIKIKPNDTTPRVKHRMTRNTEREMRECLSLQGRELLGKYCSLSDPEKTLEETQQFLTRTTAGETGGQKWTKALQTVLSNVPQDMSQNPKSESGIMSNSGFPNTSKDLAVLTVKNKITVPQNGTTDAKGVKMMTPSEKQETIPSETATVGAHCIFDTNRCQSSLNYQAHCPGAQMTLNEASISGQNESAECSQTQDNRENQEIKVNQDNDEHRRTYEELKNSKPCEDGTDASKELRQKNKRGDQKSISKSRPKKKSIRRRWRRKTRRKIKDKGTSGLGLKLVLKKNPVKDKQWMSQSSLCLLGGGLLDDYHRLPQPQRTLEETQQFLQRALSAENGLKKWTKAPTTDQHNTSKAITATSQTEKISKPEKKLSPSSGDLSTSSDTLMVKNKISIPPNCTTKPMGFKMVDGKKLLVLKVIPSTRQGIQDRTEQPLQLIETEIDSSSTGKTSQSEAEYPLNTSTNNCPENVLLQNPGISCGASRGNDNDMGSHVSDREDSSLTDMTTHGNYRAESSPVLQSPIAPQGKKLNVTKLNNIIAKVFNSNYVVEGIIITNS